MKLLITIALLLVLVGCVETEQRTSSCYLDKPITSGGVIMHEIGLYAGNSWFVVDYVYTHAQADSAVCHRNGLMQKAERDSARAGRDTLNNPPPTLTRVDMYVGGEYCGTVSYGDPVFEGADGLIITVPSKKVEKTNYDSEAMREKIRDRQAEILDQFEVEHAAEIAALNASSETAYQELIDGLGGDVEGLYKLNKEAKKDD